MDSSVEGSLSKSRHPTGAWSHCPPSRPFPLISGPSLFPQHGCPRLLLGGDSSHPLFCCHLAPLSFVPSASPLTDSAQGLPTRPCSKDPKYHSPPRRSSSSLPPSHSLLNPERPSSRPRSFPEHTTQSMASSWPLSPMQAFQSSVDLPLQQHWTLPPSRKALSLSSWEPLACSLALSSSEICSVLPLYGKTLLLPLLPLTLTLTWVGLLPPLPPFSWADKWVLSLRPSIPASQHLGGLVKKSVVYPG